MNRKRQGYILIGAGIVMALIVGVMVFNQVSEAERVRASLPKAQVVIATRDIPPRTEINASMVAVRTVPDELVLAGATPRPEDVVGKFTPNAIQKGEVISSNRVGPLAAKNAPSFKIERGKVMYALPVSFAGKPFSIAVVNALRPGDRVDLLYSTVNAPQGLSSEQRTEVAENPVPFLQTRVMLQDLRVQDIGKFGADGNLIPAVSAPAPDAAQGGQAAADPGSALSSSFIIFIVNPEEALVLKWLQDSAEYYRQNKIEMVLRSPADDEMVDPNLVVNFNYMREKYNLLPPPSINLQANR